MCVCVSQGPLDRCTCPAYWYCACIPVSRVHTSVSVTYCVCIYIYKLFFKFFNLDKRFIIVYSPNRGTVKYYLKIFTKCLGIFVMQRRRMSMIALFVDDRINEPVCQFLVALCGDWRYELSYATQEKSFIKSYYTTLYFFGSPMYCYHKQIVYLLPFATATLSRPLH